MALAIFDLDNTLIAGDSDHAWGEFLVEKKLVDADHHRQQNDFFYQKYLEGTLDIYEYLRFSLAPLSQHPKAALFALREEFFNQKIRPLILDKALGLVNSHRDKGDTLLIITATNRFVTEPIAQAFDIEHLIAIELEENETGYTGNPEGTPSYKEGKIARLEEWLKQRNESMQGATFYSDSHNDLPLLQRVEHPVAVDPDDTLRQHASQQQWKIISLRD
ncbi:MAG: HAD-IB family hydrolase [Oleiphilus sp.]|nr:MAG: HAD-IB family hydrolase [Oleiphilus sp.]